MTNAQVFAHYHCLEYRMAVLALDGPGIQNNPRDEKTSHGAVALVRQVNR